MAQQLKNQNRGATLWSLFVLSLLALANHIYLSVQHYQLKYGAAESKSFCNVNAQFNCDAIAVSAYSSISGVSVAVLGALMQLVVLILLTQHALGMTRNKERTLRYLIYISGFIALVSLVMAVISWFLVGTFCLFCIVAYVLSFISFILFWRLKPEGSLPFISDIASLGGDSKSILAILIIVPFGSWFVSNLAKDTYGMTRIEEIANDSLVNWKAAPPMNFDLNSGLKKSLPSGSAAKMTIVEFADFLCPHCKNAYPTVHAFTDGKKDVEFIFKSFPLDGTCNEAIQSRGNGVRCQLAAAAYCAEKLAQKGWQAHNVIFDNQQNFLRPGGWGKKEILKALEEKVGLDPISLDDCIESEDAVEEIKKQAKEGANAQIRGTPAVFVNGKELQGGHFIPVLEKAYREL